MKEIMKLIGAIFGAGQKYAKGGLLYEAAYKYGQAVAMMNLLYLQHTSGVIELTKAEQAALSGMRQKLETMVVSLNHSAGNGKHHLSGATKPSDALHSVLGNLTDDVFTGWLEG